MFIKGRPEVQSLVVRVRGRTAEPHTTSSMVCRRHVIWSFQLRSVGWWPLPKWRRSVIGDFDIFLLKLTVGVSDGMELKIEERARQIEALWATGYRATGGWCSPSVLFHRRLFDLFGLKENIIGSFSRHRVRAQFQVSTRWPLSYLACYALATDNHLMLTQILAHWCELEIEETRQQFVQELG